MSTPDELTTEQKKLYAKSIRKFQAIFTQKVCMAKDTSCSSDIVSSHTVSKARYLSKITESDHVLQWRYEPWGKSADDALVIGKFGINQASTFNGFCSHHDIGLFGDIDNAPFCATRQQLFAQAYRAHAREVYCKRAQIEAFPEPKETAEFHGLENPESFGRAIEAELQVVGMDAGLRDTLIHHERLRDIIKTQDFHRMRHCVVSLRGDQVISAAGSFFPDFTADGVQLQDFSDMSLALNTLHYSILPGDGEGHAVFSFFDVESVGPEKFVESVIASNKLADLLIWIAFTYVENTQARESWWVALPNEQRVSIKQAFQYNTDPYDPRLLTVSKYPGLSFSAMSAGKPFWL